MSGPTGTEGHDQGGPSARAQAVAGLDTSAAMVRAESDHLDATLHALVKRLSSVPGLKIAVSYKHGTIRRLIGDLPYVNDLHRASDPIESILVTVGHISYWLRSHAGLIECGRQARPLQPRPANETLAFSAWATTLFDDIAEQNFVNHESLVALRHLVERDRVQ